MRMSNKFVLGACLWLNLKTKSKLFLSTKLYAREERMSIQFVLGGGWLF